MALTSLTPLFIILTLVGITALGKREKASSQDDVWVYKFPVALAWLMAFLSLLFASTPLIRGIRADMDPLFFNGVFFCFSISAVCAAIYFFKYRVVIDHTYLVTGAFFKKQVSWSEIRAVTVRRGSKSSQLHVLLANGDDILFSGLLGDFDSLAEKVRNHSPNRQHA